jgi:hypothetical protein
MLLISPIQALSLSETHPRNPCALLCSEWVVFVARFGLVADRDDCGVDNVLGELNATESTLGG